MSPRPLADQTIPTAVLHAACFGLVPNTQELQNSALLQRFAAALGPLWRVATFATYAELTAALGTGQVDLAWLSPVASAYAKSRGEADIVLTIERSKSVVYASAILARRDSLGAMGLEYVNNRRAAWVDLWSAAGYLVPRQMLRRAGIDPNRAFASQAFLHSYSAVIEAVLRGAADVGAVYCSVDEKGTIVRSAWSQEQALRVLAISEAIPGDTISVSQKLGVREGRTMAARLVSLATAGVHRDLLISVFGADRFVPAQPARYAELAAALDADAAIPGH